MATVSELLRLADDLPGDNPRRDGEILLGHCLGQPRSWLYTWPERDVEAGQAHSFEALLQARREGQPVAYLTGTRDFWTLELAVNEHTLIPRPETETLVQWALELDLPEIASVVDLGTGSGAIALALAVERPGWQVCAVDSSDEALDVAENNARHNGLQRVRFVHSDWFDALGGECYHLIVSNPPYVDAADPHLCQGDLRFEPRSALVAEAEGLADFTAIVAGATGHLLPQAWLLLEHGCEQGPAVRDLLEEAGFREVSTRRDLAGLERITGGCWHAQ